MTVPLPNAVIIPAGVQMTVRFTQAGTPGAIVLGGRYIDQFNITQAIADTWLSNFLGNVRSPMSDQVTFTGATVRALGQAGGLVFEAALPAQVTGGSTSPLALAAASVLAKWRTANGTRRGRGRSFLPGVTEALTETNGRTLTAAGLGTWQNAVNGYISVQKAAANAVTPAVLSRSNLAAYEITGQSVSSQIAIQRRRMR